MVEKANLGKLLEFIFIKVYYSFITVFLFILSIFISLTISIVFFTLKLSSNTFFIIFQYYIMILYSIFLFIFALMNSIKLFGTQFEDNSFLLILTRPYSRKVIILSQYFVLFLSSLFFIVSNIITLLVFGGIIGVILKIIYIKFYILIILKLFLFLLFFSILVTNGSVAMLAFFSSEKVFLIFVIFCSLFLLGGLPSSLILNKTENLPISFKEGVGPYLVKQIKEAMLFNKYYKMGLIRYPNLTKDIADFYNSLTIDELQNINKKEVISKRQDFYKKEGFLLNSSFNSGEMEGKIDVWNGHNDFNGKTVKIVLVFNKYFINLKELKQKIEESNNDTQKDLFQLYEDYNNEFEINNFCYLQKSKIPDLLEYDLAKSYVEEGSNKKTLTSDDWTRAFKDGGYYVKFSSPLRNKYDNLFFNPIYILLRTVEDYIYNQIWIYYQVKSEKVLNDENFIAFKNNMNLYTLINYFNFIEHWNQMWTNYMGCYGNFWFKPLALSSIDFNVQKNTLFSYPDFTFHLNSEYKIDVNNTTSIQNNLIVSLFYGVLCIVLFFLSFCFFLKKNIG